MLCWAVDDVRPYRRDAQGNKTDRQRLWQVLTMREDKIVPIQDYTDQATALQAAGLPGVDLATVRELAANVEPYLRADGTRVWSLMQLERQLRPEVYGRRRGGYPDRPRTAPPMPRHGRLLSYAAFG